MPTNHKQWRWSRTAAAIPGARIWEFVVMFFAFTVGVRGLLGMSVAPLVLGPWSVVYYVIMLVAPLLFMAGQIMYPPNGLVVSIAGALLLSGMSFTVYAGLAVAMGTLLFSGYASLLVFAIGGLLRAVQMFVQLDRLSRYVTSVRREHDADSSGSIRSSSRSGD